MYYNQRGTPCSTCFIHDPRYAWKVPLKKERRFNDSKQNMRGVINHACTHFNCDINKPRLTLWHGWVITSPSFMWIYSISQEICTRFCCALLCCGYAIVHNEFTWSVYPYSSGLLCWHWAIFRLPQCQWSKPDGYVKISQCITTTKHSKAKTVCIFLGIYSNSLYMSQVKCWFNWTPLVKDAT